MPTATTTLTSPSSTHQKSKISLKATTLDSSSSSGIASTLRTLYNRAARAFVLRDIPLTNSLIQSAFTLLKPPKSNSDALTDQRRKWDILRITFESTVYLSPSSGGGGGKDKDLLPESLRANMVESPQALTSSTYTRSLTLFTPSDGEKTVLNAAYLPTQVLITLIYFSLKINAPDVGRVMIEDWLARRQPVDVDEDTDADRSGGYDKVLDLYCLHVLPKLEQWEYALEFLDYEDELMPVRRKDMKDSLRAMYAQSIQSRKSRHTATLLSSSFSNSTSNSSTPRPYSPAPSSSSSSSLSTTSTHTVVPNSSNKHKRRSSSPSPSLESARTISSEASSSGTTSNATATPRGRHSLLPNTGNGNGNGLHHHTHHRSSTHPHSRSKSKSRTHSTSSTSTSSSAYPSRSFSHLATTTTKTPSAPPTIYALLKSSLSPYLTSPRLTTFLILFVLIPAISFLVKMRRSRRLAVASGAGALMGAASGASGAMTGGVRNVDLVRRRLTGDVGVGAGGGVVGKVWGELVRVVGDTVRMAGSGLV